MVPLGLGAALSPTVLTITILILSSKYYPKARILAFLAGAAATVIVIGLVAIGAGTAVSAKANHPSIISAAVDLVLGVLLIAVGIKQIIKPSAAKKNKQEKATEAKKPSLGSQLIESVGLGIVFIVTDFSSLVLYLAAAKESNDSGLPISVKITGMSIVGFGFLAPIILPLLTTFIAPNASQKVLNSANRTLKKYGRYIGAVIALLFGVYLLTKGARIL